MTIHDIHKVTEAHSILKLAKRIAIKAHEGQKRKDGSPYIKHVELVVAQLKGNRDAQIVAWLHDVIEDSEFDEESLVEHGIDRRLADIVSLLTKKREQRYEDYIKQVKQNDLAVLVKRADLIANLIDNPSRKQIIKFSKALIQLCS